MAIEKFSAREQFLIFLVAATLILGGYSLFRFVPHNKNIGEQKAALVANQEKMKNPSILEEPIENVEKLKVEITKLDKDLLDANATLERAENNLAPVENQIQIQEVLVRISDAARSAGLEVVGNNHYIIKKKDGSSSVKPVKLSKRQQQLARRKEKKRAKAAGTYKVGDQYKVQEEVKLREPKEGELTYKLVNNLKTSRPFQQYTFKGRYFDVLNFVNALQNFDRQVTVIKIDIFANNQTPMPGIPQPITATLILAL